MPSGLQGINTLAAREVDFVHIAGGTTAGAAVGGLDVKMIATLVGTLALNLVVRPEIEKPEQLRGKSIGISRYGTSLHTGARIALRHFGMEAGKDVAIAEIGAGVMDRQRDSGRPHSRRRVRLSGDIARAQAWQSPDVGTCRRSPSPTPPTVFRPAARSIRNDPASGPALSLAAVVEASALMKKDRAFCFNVFRKYLRTDDTDLLTETYDVQIV